MKWKYMLIGRQLAVHSPWAAATPSHSGLITNPILHSLTLSHPSHQNHLYPLASAISGQEDSIIWARASFETICDSGQHTTTYMHLFYLNKGCSSD